MARSRARPSKNSPAASTPQKRAAPSTPLRQSKRQKSVSGTPAQSKTTTPKKSEYFESSSEPSESDGSADNASDFGASEESSTPSDEPEESEEYDSNEEQPKNRRSSGGRAKANGKASSSTQKGKKGGELWREGANVDAAPGTEVYIALPKARGPGSTPYRDNTIHPNTMLFLGDLKKHNDRAWLKAHDPDFRQAQKDFASFVDCITEKLMEADTTLPELPSKDLVFRIYRDIRFSKDPTPYKTHFAAAWSRTGRKSPYGQYYLQVAPGECFVGAGKWMPESPALQQLRQDVMRHPTRVRAALWNESVKKHFLGGGKISEDQAVAAFRKHNDSNALKRPPKGWTGEGVNSSLLYLRNWTIGRKLKDEEIMGPKGFDRVLELLSAMEPYITYLNRVLMPDPDQSSSDDSGDTESDSGSDEASNLSASD